MSLAAECGVSAKAAHAVEFSSITLHSWDFKRTSHVKDKQFRGWLVDRAEFDLALLKAAGDAGAEVKSGLSCAELKLGEVAATVILENGSSFTARLVLIAAGSNARLLRSAGLTAASSASAPRAALVDCESAVSDNGMEIVLGARRAAQLATLVRIGRKARVSLMTRDTASTAAQQLDELLRSGRAALRLGPPLGPIAEAPSVAGMALDIEAHVGKRALLIGDAGGFVSAFSHEGVYPAMKSGWIAAEVAARALKAPLLQDELANFSAAWRVELADYLRMPNTDLSLLAPLVFSNPQMSRRVAAAFLLGQGF